MLDAALRDGTARPPLRVRGCSRRRLPGGRRFGVVAGTGRLLELHRSDFRFGDAELDSLRDERGRGRRDPRLARGLPVHRRHLGLPRGRAVLPRLAAPRRRGHVRRGGHARDARAQRAQLRLRRRDRRRPHDRRRRRPPARRDGLAPRRRAVRGRRRPRRVHRRIRRDLQPRGRPHAGASRRWAPPRTRSRCCTTPKRTRSAPRSRRSAPARRCSSTPTTSRAGVETGRPRRRHRARRRAHRLRRPADRRGRGARAARRARRDRTRRSPSPATSTSTRSPRSRHRPVDSYGVGTSVVTGSGAPAAGMVYKLVARQDDAGDWVAVAKASTDKARSRRPQGRRPHASTRRHGARGARSSSATAPSGRAPSSSTGDAAAAAWCSSCVDGEADAAYLGPRRRRAPRARTTPTVMQELPIEAFAPRPRRAGDPDGLRRRGLDALERAAVTRRSSDS